MCFGLVADFWCLLPDGWWLCQSLSLMLLMSLMRKLLIIMPYTCSPRSCRRTDSCCRSILTLHACLYNNSNRNHMQYNSKLPVHTPAGWLVQLDIYTNCQLLISVNLTACLPARFCAPDKRDAGQRAHFAASHSTFSSLIQLSLIKTLLLPKQKK